MEMELSTSRFVSRSPDETRRLGQTVGRSLAPGEAVLLRGDLGSGKTLLARGIAESLGVTAWRGSPTLTLVNEYPASTPLFHVDLYRLNAVEVERLGLEEYARPDAILVIEWPDHGGDYLQELLGSARVELHLEHLGGDQRRITVGHPSGQLGLTISGLQ